MRLLLADDHTLFRDALIEYIRRTDEETDVVTAEDFYEAYQKLEDREDIDLILLDFKMPGMNGLDGLQKIRDSYEDVPVVLLSGVAEERDVRKAMELGARGFFPKTLSARAMMKAIELVLTGEKFLPLDENTNAIQSSYHRGKGSGNGTTNGAANGFAESEQEYFGQDCADTLTRREREVLGYLVKGASNKEIARALDVQIVTIKLHVRGICKKLNAKNRTQAALTGQRMGLI